MTPYLRDMTLEEIKIWTQRMDQGVESLAELRSLPGVLCVASEGDLASVVMDSLGSKGHVLWARIGGRWHCPVTRAARALDKEP